MAVTKELKLSVFKPEFIANGYQPAPQYGPDIIALGEGGFALSYANEFGISRTPHVSFFNERGSPVQGPLGPFFLPYSGSASTVQMQGQADIDLMPNGKTLITWLTKDLSDNTDVYSAVLDPVDGTVVAAQALITNYEIEDFDAAVLSNGYRVYAFEESLGLGISVKTPTGEHVAGYAYSE